MNKKSWFSIHVLWMCIMLCLFLCSCNLTLSVINIGEGNFRPQIQARDSQFTDSLKPNVSANANVQMRAPGSLSNEGGASLLDKTENVTPAVTSWLDNPDVESYA